MKFAMIADHAAFETYQRNLLLGVEGLSGSTLRGAPAFGGRYAARILAIGAGS